VNICRTVFLDRDGVINADSPNYIKSWTEFAFIADSLDAIVRLTQAGVDVIIVTNQSGINRGLIPRSALELIHNNLKEAVASRGGRIKDIFYCPHRPDENCSCRKPQPGMIIAARDRYDIDLASSVMVGDSSKDILAGKTAGCGGSVLVQTGNGLDAAASLQTNGTPPDHIAADLNHAARWVLDRLN